MDNRKVALITGITGQDGSYLAELLLERKVTMCMAPFAVLLQTTASVSLIWKVNLTSTFIMPTWATL